MTTHENPYPPPDNRPATASADSAADSTAEDDAPESVAVDEAGDERPKSGPGCWLPRRRPPRPAAESDGDEPKSTAADHAASTSDDQGSDAQQPTDDPEPTTPAPKRGRRRRRKRAAHDGTPSGAVDQAAPPPAEESNPGRLRRRRKGLITDRELAVYHLGGLAFELYRRDMLTADVMRRRAGAIALIDETIHEIDVRLEQLENERRARRSQSGSAPSIAGNCLTCRAPFQPAARFCWQCGARLTPPDAAADDQVTQIIAERPS